MEPHIEIKKDNRYKDGNIVKKHGKLVGNAKTVELKRLDYPGLLNPPIIVSDALAEELKKQGFAS